MLPGLRMPVGSQIFLKSPKAEIICGEYMIGSNSDRARPSPCSPDSEPPCATTNAAASVQNARMTARPSALRRSKVMRTCMQ